MKKSSSCSRGCGRRTHRPDGVCYDCSTGRALPLPKVELLPDVYVAEVVEEAIRREARRRAEAEDGRQRLTAAVARLGGGA